MMTLLSPASRASAIGFVMYYRHHVFFCTNLRTDGRQSCESCGASAMRSYAKDKVKKLGLAGPVGVRFNTAGCLDRCEEGPVIVSYPEGVWYSYGDQEDIDEIISEHRRQGRVVERLKRRAGPCCVRHCGRWLLGTPRSAGRSAAPPPGLYRGRASCRIPRFLKPAFSGFIKMKTFNAKAETVKRDWYVVDASGKTLGRMASEIARRLRGKHKAEYTPHVDTGDYIVVVNADKVRVSGKKTTDKIYHHHTSNMDTIRSFNIAKIKEHAPESDITINSRTIEDYFGRETARRIVRQPLELTNTVNSMDLAVTVRGGGNSGQAGAIRHGIARALVEHDEALRSPLRRAGFLTRDAREVERKKVGLHKARKRPQYSKR